MGDDLSLPERNAARTPMQWSTEANGGFTRARKPVLPVISSGPYANDEINAADQRRDPQSFLNWTERMIRMRKEAPELGWGAFSILELDEPGVLAIRYVWRNVGVLTLHNLRDAALEIELSLDRGDGMRLSNLLTGHHSEADRRGRHRIVMEP